MVVCGMSYEPFHECSKLDKYFLSRNTVSVNAAPVKKCDERSGIWRYCLSPLRCAQGQALSAAKCLARRTQRSFAALRMTTRTPHKSAHGTTYLQISNERICLHDPSYH